MGEHKNVCACNFKHAESNAHSCVRLDDVKTPKGVKWDRIKVKPHIRGWLCGCAGSEESKYTFTFSTACKVGLKMNEDHIVKHELKLLMF